MLARRTDTYVVLALWRNGIHELRLSHVVLAGLRVLDGERAELGARLLRELGAILFNTHQALLHAVLDFLHLLFDLLHDFELVALQLRGLLRSTVRVVSGRAGDAVR